MLNSSFVEKVWKNITYFIAYAMLYLADNNSASFFKTLQAMKNTEIKIAMVDEMQAVRIGIAHCINKVKDYKVVLHANSGKELLCSLSEIEELPDICITETTKSEINGYKTLIELKKKYPQIKILVLSAWEIEYTIIKMLRLGVRGYLSKSCDYPELLHAIKSIKNDGYYYSQLAPKTLFKKALNGNFSEISKDEKKYLSLLCLQYSGDEIAERMHKSPDEIMKCHNSLCQKFNGILGAVAYAEQNGFKFKSFNFF